MRSRTNNGSNLEQRVFQTIHDVRSVISENPNTAIYSRRSGHSSLFYLCAQYLEKIGVIYNAKPAHNSVPERYWKEGNVIDNRLVNKITAMIREYRRRFYPESKTAKISIEESVQQVNEPQVAKALFLSLTDRQLWDELIHRGYEIKDGRLCKVMYLD